MTSWRSAGALGAVGMLLAGGCMWRAGGDERRDAPLRVAIVRPESLDPAHARSIDEQFVAAQLFDTLVALDPLSAVPEPGIAESWTTSADGLVWEFTLGDVMFANGDPVTAFDVEATYDRAVAKATGSAVADLLEPVVGWREAAIDGTVADLAGVTAVGDSVVRITLASPWASLPSALAHPGLGIVPRALAGADGFDEEPTGSGPYEVESRDATTIALRAADDGRARQQQVELHLFASQTDAYAAFVAGRVDWSAVPVASVADAARRYGRRHFRGFVAELFYAFDLRDPVWSDRRLREAVVRAVDRDAIIDEVYAGTMRPMTSFAVDGVPGAVPDTCGDACRVDPERSRALLAEVSTSSPIPPISIDLDNDPTQVAVAERIASDLRSVGFTVTLRPEPLEEYERFAVSGDKDLFRLGWIAAYPDLDAFVAPLFSSGSANNLSGFDVAHVDDGIRQARATIDPLARASLYEQVERAVFAEFAVVPLGHFRQHAVAAERVRGVELSVTGVFDLAAVWLAA